MGCQVDARMALACRKQQEGIHLLMLLTGILGGGGGGGGEEGGGGGWLAQGQIHGQTGAAYGLYARARVSRYCIAHCGASVYWSFGLPPGRPYHALQLTCLGHSTGSTQHTAG